MLAPGVYRSLQPAPRSHPAIRDPASLQHGQLQGGLGEGREGKRSAQRVTPWVLDVFTETGPLAQVTVLLLICLPLRETWYETHPRKVLP